MVSLAARILEPSLRAFRPLSRVGPPRLPSVPWLTDISGLSFSPGTVLLTAMTAGEIRCPIALLIAGCPLSGLPSLGDIWPTVLGPVVVVR